MYFFIWHYSKLIELTHQFILKKCPFSNKDNTSGSEFSFLKLLLPILHSYQSSDTPYDITRERAHTVCRAKNTKTVLMKRDEEYLNYRINHVTFD